MKKKSFSILICFCAILVFCSFQDPKKYNSMVKFSAEVIKNDTGINRWPQSGDQFIIRATLTNTTDTKIVYIREACDRNTSYYFDACKGAKGIHIRESDLNCYWNGAVRYELAAHATAIDTFDFGLSTHNKKFRIGFNFIPLKIFNSDSLKKNFSGQLVPGWEFTEVKNIIWSDTLEIK